MTNGALGVRRAAAAALVAALALTAGGCARASRPAAATAPGEVRSDAVPRELLGLRADAEEIGDALKEVGDRAYVSDIKLWSLREGKRLRATLQVSRFAPDAPSGDEEFQAQVAGQVGGSTPRLRRLGGDRVYVSTGNRQLFFMWFRGIHFVVLTVPAETRNARALLRAALAEVTP